MLRAALILGFVVPVPGAAALAEDAVSAAQLTAHLTDLDDADLPLKAVRAALPDCEPGCITPGEATAMALSAAEGEAQPGRFLLDIRGGGQSFQGELGTMMFVNSRQDYATLGTLTIAFEPEALQALLRRAQVCGAADVVEGQITVKACYTEGPPDLNMFTMMQRLVVGASSLRAMCAGNGSTPRSAHPARSRTSAASMRWATIRSGCTSPKPRR